MSSPTSALVALTVIVAILLSLIVFAMLRFMAVARESRRRGKAADEVAMLSTALHDAVTKLKAQERATAARAEASERLSEEIIASLTAGLLVVDLKAEIRILNPAGRGILGLSESLAIENENYRVVLAKPLSEMIDKCLETHATIRRRTVKLSEGQKVTHLGVSVSPLSDSRGELHGAICLFSDLSAVKDLEEQLRLKDSLAAIGELTAGIAHEFRNGLATIQGYSQLTPLRALPQPSRPFL